mmetsp:Transcript_27656/g.67041  ORF Transcript_27656/g.67041 Transcript_27656/m.67041 type:complete len:243 (+) Transcript_27656:126-854(+)
MLRLLPFLFVFLLLLAHFVLELEIILRVEACAVVGEVDGNRTRGAALLPEPVADRRRANHKEKQRQVVRARGGRLPFPLPREEFAAAVGGRGPVLAAGALLQTHGVVGALLVAGEGAVAQAAVGARAVFMVGSARFVRLGLLVIAQLVGGRGRLRQRQLVAQRLLAPQLFASADGDTRRVVRSLAVAFHPPRAAAAPVLRAILVVVAAVLRARGDERRRGVLVLLVRRRRRRTRRRRRRRKL